MNSQALQIENSGISSTTIQAVTDLVGRIGLAAIFLLSGINKIQFYEANAQFMASVGLPSGLLPLAIAFEIIGAALLIVGYKTRWVALAFVGFNLTTAFIFHSNLGDQIQFIMFFKNIAIAGGFLILFSNSISQLL